MSNSNRQDDLMGSTSFGRAALKKLGPVSENFRIFSAEWVGKTPDGWKFMRVSGAEFRAETKGQDVGSLSVKVPLTTRTVVVTSEEIRAAELVHQPALNPRAKP